MSCALKSYEPNKRPFEKFQQSDASRMHQRDNNWNYMSKKQCPADHTIKSTLYHADSGYFSACDDDASEGAALVFRAEDDSISIASNPPMLIVPNTSFGGDNISFNINDGYDTVDDDEDDY